LYVYANNDPVNYVDRTGRQAAPAIPWFGPILGGAAGGAAIGSAAGGIGAIPGAIIGALLGAAILSVPGDTPMDGDSCNIRGEGRELDRIAKDQGISRDALRKAIEAIKKSAGLRGDENVDILPDGTVVDPVSGDPIGNIHDEQGN
jgi:hypothetical protein